MDVEAIRRMWPDVLTRVYQQRRATWTFVSEHAQVIDYDGKRLRLAISTEGLLNTFRRGPHAELVRQALIDVLGVDAQVEGIRLEGAPAAARPQVTAPAPPPEVSADDRAAAAARSWDEPPPDLADDTERGPDPAPPTEPTGPTSRQSAERAAAQQRSDPGATGGPEPDEPHPDDPDVDGSGLVGQPVVEQLLGGRVITEP